MMDELIAGCNPVREALRAGRPVNKIFLARSNDAVAREICRLARMNQVPVQRVERAHLDKLLPDIAHQGVAARVAPVSYAELEDVLVGQEEPFLVILAGVTDPRNLGAIIRTACAAGAGGVVIPKHRAAPLTAAAVKAAAGAVEHVPIVRVGNLARAIDELKEKGLWVVGADPEAQELYWDVSLTGPVAVVIGGEGRGLGRLIAGKCDLLVKIPMVGPVESLNASVAAALLLYEVARQKRSG